MKKLFIFLVIIMSGFRSFANNVVISNVSIINNGPGNILVRFDLSWDNSWRVTTGQANYDGAWVFFKYKTANGTWTHLNLTGNNNIAAPGSEIFQNSGTVKYGAMIFRSSSNTGTGSVNFANVQLGVSDALPYNVDINGFAVEMVYIPPVSGTNAGIVLGDGDGVSESLGALHTVDNSSTTLLSSGSVTIKCDPFVDDATLQTGIKISTSGGISGINANFPIGEAVWSMKYELSQAGYRDFLNTLTLAQQTSRIFNSPTSPIGTGAFQGTVVSIEVEVPSTSGSAAVFGCDANGNNIFDEADDGEWRAMGFLTWVDLAAWLDWSGLAPMTEIDFERICRGFTSAGPNPSVFHEYAWGTSTVFSSQYILTAANTASEAVSNASTTIGNAMYSATSPPLTGLLRNGIFATATSNRVTSGASFYGVMELTGNAWEECVSLGNVAGRSFRALNGNGLLSINGNANVSFWPCGDINTVASSCSEITGVAGMSLRGGTAGNNILVLALSRRGGETFSARSPAAGGRGVLYVQ